MRFEIATSFVRIASGIGRVPFFFGVPTPKVGPFNFDGFEFIIGATNGEREINEKSERDGGRWSN